MAGSADQESLTRTSLNGHGIFAIIVFAIVALICIQPVHIPIPHRVSEAAGALRQRLVGERSPEAHHESEDSTPEPPRANGAGEEIEREVVEPTADASMASGDGKGPRVRKYLVLNHVWTPAIGILFLLATKTIGGEQIKLGIVGEEGVEPYDVLALFLGLAYIAISLDATGLLRYLAFQVCLKAGSSGRRLYLILYAFFWTLGVLVGNDPVILSGTAFLVYLTRVAGISPPSAWIWAQFVAANISSAVLVSSNPTNLVIASGFRISFPVYTAYMILPAFVSALVSLLVLLVFFRNREAKPARERTTPKQSWQQVLRHSRVLPKAAHELRSRSTSRATGPSSEHDIRLETVGSDETQDEKPIVAEAGPGQRDETATDDEDSGYRPSPTIFIPKTIVRPDVDARAALVDPYGAIYNSIVMAATLVTLIATSVTGGVKVYMIAAPGAGVCLLRDIAYDFYTWRSVRQHRAKEQKGDTETKNNGNGSPAHREGRSTATSTNGKAHSVPRPLLGRMMDKLNLVREMFPTVSYVAARLPLPLLPFAFGMFILVQSLAHVGFVNILAKGLGDVCTHGYIGCSFFLSTLGVILCNLGGTNIGATILLTKALQSSYFSSRLAPQDAALILKAASYAVAFGSNVGALGGTFAASLAGLLWRDGLRQRGVLVTKWQFAKWCAVVIVPALVSGVAILLPEVRYFTV